MSNGTGHRLVRWQWLLVGSAVASGCANTKEEPFTVPFRHAPPPEGRPAPQATEQPGDPSGAPAEDAPPPEASTDYCPDVGFGTPCRLPDGRCGLDFGFGCIDLPSEAGAPAPPPPAPTADASVGDAASTDSDAAVDGGGNGSTTVEVHCRHAGDCGQDEVCCGVRDGGSYTVFECRDTCDSSSTSVSCSGPEHCTGDQICCGTRETTFLDPLGYYSGLACTESCSGGTQHVQCGSDEDCGDGTTCQASSLLPEGFTVCLAAPPDASSPPDAPDASAPDAG